MKQKTKKCTLCKKQYKPHPLKSNGTLYGLCKKCYNKRCTTPKGFLENFYKNSIEWGNCKYCGTKCEILQHYSVKGLCLKCIKEKVPKMKPLTL